jgi:PKD repeat protein
MDVTFYDASDDGVIGTDTNVASGSRASIKWNGRAYDTTYSWYAIANDGITNGPQSTTWSFTTRSEPTGDNGGPPGDGGVTNQDPVADASASEQEGFVDTPVFLDGSLSTDSDGDIVSYEWTFGDGSSGTGVTTTHTYAEPKMYTVTLTVTDNEDATDVDIITVTITQPNRPPTGPVLEDGPISGTKNTLYSYTVVSTDADNDTIQYIFDWDDGETTNTTFLANGTSATQNHTWDSPGIYTIVIYAMDENNATSDPTEVMVSIDALMVDDLGYLIDEDADGTYDSFYNTTSDQETDVELQDDGTYLIDDDGDNQWDWIYDPETNQLTKYEPEPEEPMDYTYLLILLAIIIILIIIIAAVMARKKGKGKTPPKPETEKKPETKKKTPSKKPKE